MDSHEFDIRLRADLDPRTADYEHRELRAAAEQAGGPKRYVTYIRDAEGLRVAKIVPPDSEDPGAKPRVSPFRSAVALVASVVLVILGIAPGDPLVLGLGCGFTLLFTVHLLVVGRSKNRPQG